jgi:hypothetical protein
MAIKQSSVPITLRISEETLNTVSREFQSTPVAEALGSRCSQFVEALANGGFMLSGDHVRAIETNYKRPVSNPKDVIKATEVSAKKEDGRNVYSFSIDPAEEPRLLERATEIGRTPAELMRDVIEYALDNEWVYSIHVEGVRRYFTNQQEDEFADMLDKKSFTIGDILAFCKSRKKRLEEKPELIEA